MSGVAYANFGPHGGYSKDTDACAGCHRAHTSFSPIQRTEYLNGTPTGNLVGSALLVSSAQNMTEFCYVCHGNDAPGASTNVAAGLFDGGPSTDINDATLDGVQALYNTNSSFDTTLNGGGFDTMGLSGTSVTSMHNMAPEAVSNNMTGTVAPMWGYGASATAATGVLAEFNCTSCHDPHGSSNYRLLKDSLPGGAVGGYSLLGVPTPYVVSSEEGYPILGWKKHQDGADQMATYKPNYTAPQYRNNGLMDQNISGWCAGCHERYDESGTAYNYEGYLADGATEVGTRDFHRHPVNRPVAAFPNSSLAVEPITDGLLPLEPNMAAAEQAGTATWNLGDSIGCLTCHRAHGETSQMSGWAESGVVNSASASTSWTVQLEPGTGGVNPNKSSALLRADNRGVCERCHNK